MKKLISIIIMLIITNFCFAETGNSGMGFLKMPASAGSASTMSVFAPISESANALFENPVGIFSNNTNINFTHNFWFADVSQDVISVSVPTKLGTFSGGLNFVRIPGIEVRNRPTEEPLEEIEAQYLATAIGYANKFFDKVIIGGTVKYLYESLYTESGTGVAVDLGARCKIPGNLDLSLSLNNLGKMGKLDNIETTLPTTMQIGIIHPQLYKNDIIRGSLGLSVTSNLNSSVTSVLFGTQIQLYNKFKLSGGYGFQGDNTKASLGVGINIKKIQLDYAMLFIEKGLEYPHIITLSWGL